nr:MAG TPA: hypothetical protein [Caudoviricetes sp.]
MTRPSGPISCSGARPTRTSRRIYASCNQSTQRTLYRYARCAIGLR